MEGKTAHLAVETEAFYRKMRRVEACEYKETRVEAEPFDCQLECRLRMGLGGTGRHWEAPPWFFQKFYSFTKNP